MKNCEICGNPFIPNFSETMCDECFEDADEAAGPSYSVASDVAKLLAGMLKGGIDRDETDDLVLNVESFEAAGVLTNNAGIVLRTTSGREFQITVVRSR